MARYNPLLPIITRPCFKYVIQGECQGQSVVNTFYYVQSEGATTVPALGDLHDAINTLITPDFLAVHAVSYKRLQSTLYRWDDPTQMPNIRIDPLAGTVAEPALPTWVTLDIYRLTRFGGQRGRGMIRLGGLPETANNQGKVDAAFIATVETFRDTMKASFATVNPTDGSFEPALLTRTIGLGPTFPVTVRGATLLDTEYRSRLGGQNTRKLRLPG